MINTPVHLWAPGFSHFGGGITAFSRELATALHESDVSIRLFGKADAFGNWNGIALDGAAKWPAVLRSGGFALKGAKGAWIHKPQRIVSTHLNFGPAVQWAARLARCPYALVAHGVDVHPGLSFSRLRAMRQADSLFAVSSWTRGLLLDLGGIDPAKIQILPNTYDDSRFLPGPYPRPLAFRYGIASDEKIILTVARLDPGEGYKGYDRILRALPGVRQACGKVRYIIAGKGGDRPRIEAMARELGVEQSVVFAGFVPDDELADHYRLADVFAMPSTGEGFGIVFLEAMGCGTPVLAGNRDGSVDAVDQGRLGQLADPQCVNAIADGLVALLQSKGQSFWFERSRLSQAVKETYGREAFRKRVESLFR